MRYFLLLVVIVFSLHIVWESQHVELYGGYDDLSPYLPITVWATIGDVLYTLGALFLVSVFKKSIHWMRHAKWHDYFGLMVLGFFTSLFVEYKAMVFERWYYLDTMPIIPVLGVGLSPILQMIILLPLSVYVANIVFARFLGEQVFLPKEGQVDFTHIRYAPVINCVVRYNDKILLVKRNPKMRLYPNLWNGISGFLDDERSIEQKTKDELSEESSIDENQIVSMKRGPVFNQEESRYGKTWIVHPILVDVRSDQIKLDWEAAEYRWVRPEEIKNLDLLPGFDKVLSSFSELNY